MCDLNHVRWYGWAQLRAAPLHPSFCLTCQCSSTQKLMTSNFSTTVWTYRRYQFKIHTSVRKYFTYVVIITPTIKEGGKKRINFYLFPHGLGFFVHLKAICTLSVSVFAQSSHSAILMGGSEGRGWGRRERKASHSNKRRNEKRNRIIWFLNLKKKIIAQVFVDASREG